jgi:hypothetical protein
VVNHGNSGRAEKHEEGLSPCAPQRREFLCWQGACVWTMLQGGEGGRARDGRQSESHWPAWVDSAKLEKKAKTSRGSSADGNNKPGMVEGNSRRVTNGRRRRLLRVRLQSEQCLLRSPSHIFAFIAQSLL